MSRFGDNSNFAVFSSDFLFHILSWLCIYYINVSIIRRRGGAGGGGVSIWGVGSGRERVIQIACNLVLSS